MNHFNTLFCFFILLILASCGSKLRRDHGAIAFNSNFYSAEFKACGEIHHGVASCPVEEGMLFNDVKLQIQGYSSGTIKISSEGCDLSQDVFRYENNDLIGIEILGKVEQSCFIQFVVQPEYSERQTQDLVLEDFKGAIYLKKTKQSWTALTKGVRVKQFNTSKWAIPFQDGPDVRAVFISDRCDINYDQRLKVIDNKVELDLKQLFPKITDDVQTCILSGALIGESKKVRLSWLISVYDEKYQRLPIPKVRFKRKKIRISGDLNTSIISLNRKYKIDKKAKFKFNKSKKNIVRLLTVKGRSRIGIWNPKERRFLWK